MRVGGAGEERNPLLDDNGIPDRPRPRGAGLPHGREDAPCVEASPAHGISGDSASDGERKTCTCTHSQVTVTRTSCNYM